MPSDRSDIWAGIGAIVSSILSAYAWFYEIGLVPLFTFVAGSLFTLWRVERLEKKRRKQNFQIKMTEHIYGPLHKILTSIRTELRRFQTISGASLDVTMNDYRFNLVKEDLSSRIQDFKDRLHSYNSLLSEARRETGTHIGRAISKHKLKGGISFDILSADQEMNNIGIGEPIFRDKTPLDYLTERAKTFRNPLMIVRVRGKSEGRFSSEHRIHKISLDILKEVREDPMVQEYRTERGDLLKECNSLLEAIEKEFVL